MVLAVSELSVQRGDFSLAIESWDVAAGALSVVLGTNGAGKSTLFSVLGGDTPFNGEVRFHGRDLRQWPDAARARHIGVLLQQTQLAFAFTAEEVVGLGLTPLTLSWRDGQRLVRSVMQRTDTAHLAHRAYPELSGGERQRVNLARVLLQLSQAESTPLLLLDEPTSAQDLGHQHALLRLARELAKEENYAVVAILHDLNQALEYGHRCLVLDRGVVAKEGVPLEVLEPALVARYWGYRPERMAGDARVALI